MSTDIKYNIDEIIATEKFPEPKPEHNPFDDLQSRDIMTDLDNARTVDGGKVSVDLDFKNKGITVTYTKEI